MSGKKVFFPIGMREGWVRDLARECEKCGEKIFSHIFGRPFFLPRGPFTILCFLPLSTFLSMFYVLFFTRFRICRAKKCRKEWGTTEPSFPSLLLRTKVQFLVFVLAVCCECVRCVPGNGWVSLYPRRGISTLPERAYSARDLRGKRWMIDSALSPHFLLPVCSLELGPCDDVWAVCKLRPEERAREREGEREREREITKRDEK